MVKIKKFINFLENISKERFLLENDGKISFEKKKILAAFCKFSKSLNFCHMNFSRFYRVLKIKKFKIFFLEHIVNLCGLQNKTNKNWTEVFEKAIY